MRLEDKKIILLREAGGISKMALADVMHTDENKVNKVEKGLAQYTDAQVVNAKKFFKIEGMPLSDFECAVYKKRLYMLHDYIRDRRFDEARALCDEMAKLINLEDCDNDLPILYRLFEVAALIYCYNNLDAAERELDYLKRRISGMTQEHMYHYYFYTGTLLLIRGSYYESLDLYKQAHELSNSLSFLTPEDVKRLHLGIASCFSRLEYPNRAIFYMLETYELYSNRNRKISIIDIHFDCLLAQNYVFVNEFEKAEKLLNNCLVSAKTIEDDF